MKHTIKNYSTPIHYVALEPLSDKIKSGMVDVGGSLSTGYSLLIYSDDIEQAHSMAFNGHGDCSSCEEFVWVTSPDKELVEQLIFVLNRSTLFKVNYKKHPSEDKWAFPMKQCLMDTYPENKHKKQLRNLIAGTSIKKKNAMLQDGWK